MKKIILFSEKENDSLWEQLKERLAQLHTVTVVSRQTLETVGDGEEILLILCRPSPRSIRLEDAAVVFSSGIPAGFSAQLGEACVCIVNSDNEDFSNILPACRVPVLTCGMSPKDTVTYSGRSGESVSISLQREMINCRGEHVEPLEVVFSPDKAAQSYVPLALTAVLLWLGEEELLREQSIPLSALSE